MLNKMGGVWAPKPSCGPHKQRECLPLLLIIRNRLKYALTNHEVKMICMQRLVKVDGKPSPPVSWVICLEFVLVSDVVTLEGSSDRFRLLYDVKGRFVLHRIDENEAQYKLCKVVKRQLSSKKIPFIVTHDARTIRFPDPSVKVNDTVKVDLKTNKVIGHVKFEVGNLCFITKGHNIGRVGVIVHRDRHFGSFDIVHVRDAAGHEFATRLSNVFIIGEGNQPMVSLPKGNGVRLSIIEEKEMREKKN